ncbi:Probable RNA-directed DNA polymerase from transposon X-element [Eumeta japonica]|uniref:Probable RNA-directed DNA polymerase from transposon X-element n=1 Tax=Eumeta variegata TaxID=151549 RepID=A0A4C1W7Q8_EUMVA|nr:Probable RNA-directed DNA polymerase from transposon X-element [Eumeta japonica]
MQPQRTVVTQKKLQEWSSSQRWSSVTPIKNKSNRYSFKNRQIKVSLAGKFLELRLRTILWGVRLSPVDEPMNGIGLGEVRRKGCNVEEHQEYILCYIGKTTGLYGVGFLVKKIYKQNIVSFTGISESVAVLKLKYEHELLTLVQAYAPTEQASEEETDKFYNYIRKAQENQDRNVIIRGDFNARVGQPKKYEKIIMGNFGYGKRNERGNKLVQYVCEQKLSIMNTYFKKGADRRWTWISPDQKTVNEIDYIMCNKPKQITNIEVLNNVPFPSDHRLLRSSFSLKSPKKSRKTYSSSPKLRKTDDEKLLYSASLNKILETKFCVLPEENNVQNYYDKLEYAITSSLKIKYNNSKDETKTLSRTTKDLMDKRTKLMHTKHKTKEMKEELKNLFKMCSKAIKNDYNKYKREVVERNLNKYRSSKRAYKELMTHRNWNGKGYGETKTRQDVINHATKFYKELYKKYSETNEIEDSHKDFEEEEETVKPIDECEVLEHLKNSKQKSPGPDNITNEILKIGAPLLLSHRTLVFNLSLKTEEVPKQWCNSNIVLLYKKGDPLDIGNYRPISLLPSIYKLFTTILLSRITPIIDASKPIEQAGFRSGFSTIDHIHALEQILEKYKEFNQLLYVAYVDYTKAFDTITHTSIWKALNVCGVSKTYINIIKSIYSKSTSRIKMENKGEQISTEKRVKQGDPLSPKLFTAVLECVFRNLDWSQNSICVLGHHLSHLRFADDIIVFAKSAKELEQMMQSLAY